MSSTKHFSSTSIFAKCLLMRVGEISIDSFIDLGEQRAEGSPFSKRHFVGCWMTIEHEKLCSALNLGFHSGTESVLQRK